MVRYFSPLHMVGRASSDLDAFPGCSNTYHCLLSALPLEYDDCVDRRLGAARAARDRAHACSRDRRYDRRLRTWAERALSDPRGVLRGGVAFDRTGAWCADRLCSRRDRVHPLCRVAVGPSGLYLHRNCSILAKLDLDLATGRLFLSANRWGTMCWHLTW